MGRKPVDPSIKAVALALVREEGMSARQAAEQCGVSAQSVVRWLDENPPEDEHEEGGPPPDVTLEEGLPGVLKGLRGMAEFLIAESQKAAKAGPAQARHASSMAGHAANIIARLARVEAAVNADPGSLRVSKEELELAERRIAEQIAAALNRPLLCAHCSRQLALEWGGPDAVAAAKELDALTLTHQK